MTTIRAALVIQTCVAGDFERNLDSTLDTISIAAGLKADILVFPEMNLTGYAPADVSIARSIKPDWLGQISCAASKYNMAILAGLLERASDNKVYATHLVIRPGYDPGFYRKIHLSPFEAPYFTPGNSVKVFKFKKACFGIQLCYDAHFPELATAMALKKVDMIFIPHASPRTSPEEKFLSWMRHLPARAFDNGVFVAAVNQTGENGRGLEFPGLALAIGPDGHLMSKKMGNKPGIHMVEMDLSAITRVRSHKMRYFLPNRRPDLIE
ncbi:MAG: amidohydrolase [Desulfobacter sp.]|nr:amidohydrolase [Desulfobacter sp.]